MNETKWYIVKLKLKIGPFKGFFKNVIFCPRLLQHRLIPAGIRSLTKIQIKTQTEQRMKMKT